MLPGVGLPPTASTLPSASAIELWNSRWEVMLPVPDHVPVAGSYSSEDAKMPPQRFPPPLTSTLPLGSAVAFAS